MQDDTKIDSTYITKSLKIGDTKVNIISSFHPEKSLYDAMFAIASARLKGNPM